MAKILFVNPIVREEDVPRHIPYGIALLASICINRGHKVQVFDANAWRLSDDFLYQVLDADDWDIIAIGGLTTTYGHIKKIVKIAKHNNPTTPIVAGGGFLTSMPREIMQWLPEITYGVVGEAFETFPELVETIKDSSNSINKVKGIVYRLKGEIKLTPIRPLIKDLDDLPWPAWDLFPLEEVYFKNSSSLFSEEAYISKRRIDINGSFGCGLICRYCWHLGTTGDMIIGQNASGNDDVQFTFGRHVRMHSPRYLVDMVKHLRNTYNIDFVNFLDENLMTVNTSSRYKWLSEICELWIAEGLQPKSRKEKRSVSAEDAGDGVYFSGTSHASLHYPEILEKMYEAGCTHLVYGLESFDPKILKDLGKGSTRKNNIESVGVCLNSGIKPIPNIIVGFPDETYDSVRNTISALIELGIHAKPHFATAYPGSEWFNAFKHEIIKQYNGNLENYILDLGDATKITATISKHFTPAELLGLQTLIANKDLRNLGLSEQYANKTKDISTSFFGENPEWNFKASKEKTPIAEDPSKVLTTYGK